MEEMISVNNLRKEFSYYKKGVGLQGSLNNLFHRQMLTKKAVKDVSFSVGKGEMMALRPSRALAWRFEPARSPAWSEATAQERRRH